jgi:parallel beta-helix repeat protein
MDYRTSYSGTTKVANIHTSWSVVPNTTSVYELTKPGPLIGAANKSYIVWKGFKIVEGDSYAPDTGPVVIVSSNDITLTDIEIVGTTLPIHLDNHNGIRIENSNNIVVRNTSIHGYKTNPGSINNTNNSAAIMVYTSDNLIFENNNIYDTSLGIFLKGGNGGHIVRYNRISDCDKAFRTSYHTNVSFYQNIIENCNVSYNPAENIDTIRFYNNIIVNATWGIYNWFPTNGFDSYNNIFYNVTNPHFWEDVTGTFTTDHNDYFTYNSFVRANRSVGGLTEWQALGFDSGSISVNPGFVNFSSGDYHLQPNSPLITAGRNSSPIGAYITGNEVIGINTGGVSPSPSPTPTPTPPPPTPTPFPDSNLTILSISTTIPASFFISSIDSVSSGFASICACTLLRFSFRILSAVPAVLSSTEILS